MVGDAAPRVRERGGVSRDAGPVTGGVPRRAAARRGSEGQRGRPLPLEDLVGEAGRLARGLADLDAGGLERDLLRLGGAGGAGDDGSGVAHGLALGGGETGDVADNRLG